MTTAQINEFQTAIDSLVTFAKSVKFNFEKDSFDALLVNWINQSKKQHEEILFRSKESINILKQIINH